MDAFERSSLWRRALGDPSNQGAFPNSDLERLRVAFRSIRERVQLLAQEIPQHMRELTVHDITHIDALWEVASTIAGDEYPINPAEGFVLGCAFLIHDLGLALAAYPGQLDELRKEGAWQDAAALEWRRRHGSSRRINAATQLPADVLEAATDSALRQLHAERAEHLVTAAYQYRSADSQFFLIDDVELRIYYGQLIGRIAHSHWWPIDRVVNDFQGIVGAMPGRPVSWTVDPLKLACLLRATDACHLDARRAPSFLMALRKPRGVAESHWRAQQYLMAPVRVDHQIAFSSPRAFPCSQSKDWWLAYDLISIADRELRDVETALSENHRNVFAARSAKGAGDPKRLARDLRSDGWSPVDTELRVTDAAELVRKLGGAALYGRDPVVPLKELIQNARDAVQARRLLERRGEHWGEITVRLISENGSDSVEVSDNGIGMSASVLTRSLLDFGKSLWESSDVAGELPGLLATGFQSLGRFGIGFYSVFMWGQKVIVRSRSRTAGPSGTLVLEFDNGTFGRPILRDAFSSEQLIEPGTVVRVLLEQPAKTAGNLLGPGKFGGSDPSSAVQRDNGWTLFDLCRWLCPALDVDLYVVENGKRERAVADSDWKTMPGETLLERLVFAYGGSPAAFKTDYFRQLCDNLRPVYDSEQQIVGRVCIMPYNDVSEVPHVERAAPYFQPIGHNVAGVLTDGPFRSQPLMFMTGVLVGSASSAARSRSVPVIEPGPEMGVWATGQSDLVGHLTKRHSRIAVCAGLVRRLGGSTENLPIVRTDRGFLSFNEIASSIDLPGRIELVEDHWPLEDGGTRQLLLNQFGVAQGRMENLWYGARDIPDFCGRGAHREWRRFWKTLWGATIEAISRAWGEQIDDVLQASQIWDFKSEPRHVDVVIRPRARS
jgi:Histidine kinase-, DNA gyrase B-, and HSP90-like ATPase